MRRSSKSTKMWMAMGAMAMGWLGGCGGDGADDSVVDAGPISFAADIKPIFDSKCISCHHPDSAIDVDLTNPFDPEHGIIERENTWVPAGSEQTLIVDPGNLDNSFLIKKVEGDSLEDHKDGGPMPMEVARVTADELERIKQWIQDGAQNDDYFAQNVAPIFGTEISLRGTAGKCTWCHYPGSPTGLDVLNPFDPEEGMVGRESTYGGIIVAPGDVEGSFLIEKLEQMDPAGGFPMPYQPPPLTADELARVRAWIAQGALNN